MTTTQSQILIKQRLKKLINSNFEKTNFKKLNKKLNQ